MSAAHVRSRWNASGDQEYVTRSGTEIATMDAARGVLRGPGLALHVRRRFTIEQVNLGAALLVAVPNRRYRLLDARALAIGGNAGAVTTVDLLATQGAASVKLAAFARASLTQDAVIGVGLAGATLLAGGASLAPNDVNTGISVGKTGPDLTTATHIDVVLTYAIEE